MTRRNKSRRYKNGHNRVKHRAYMRAWVAARRLLWVDWFGHRCARCDETDASKLQFHHVDPSSKMFIPSQVMSWSAREAEKELRKCILLCVKCHLQEHRDCELHMEPAEVPF